MAKLKSADANVKVALPKEEPKKERSIDEVKQEFSTLCAQAGQINYQVYTFQKDLELINNQLRNLNFEAAAIQSKAVEAAKNE